MLKTKQTNKKKNPKKPESHPTVSCQLLTAYYLYCLLPILLTTYTAHWLLPAAYCQNAFAHVL